MPFSAHAWQRLETSCLYTQSVLCCTFRGRLTLWVWLLVRPPCHAEVQELPLRTILRVSLVMTGKLQSKWAGATTVNVRVPTICAKEAVLLMLPPGPTCRSVAFGQRAPNRATAREEGRGLGAGMRGALGAGGVPRGTPPRTSRDGDQRRDAKPAG